MIEVSELQNYLARHDMVQPDHVTVRIQPNGCRCASHVVIDGHPTLGRVERSRRHALPKVFSPKIECGTGK